MNDIRGMEPLSKAVDGTPELLENEIDTAQE
jgi:hypothetical protein